jgi:hypothetical protein
MGGIPANFCGIHGTTAEKCFDLHNPNAHKKVGWPAWSAQKNDMIGGWIVTTYPHPASEHDFSGQGEKPTWENRHTAKLRCGYVVADCLREQDAIFIATKLNSEKYVPDEAQENPSYWRWVEVGYLEGSLRSL